MAWRGRGRGRGSMNQGLELPDGLNVNFAEVPLYPSLNVIKPSPPTQPEQSEYEIYQSMTEEIKNSMFYIPQPPEKPEMARYSDRYIQAEKKPPFTQSIKKLKINLTFFPEELHSVINGSKRKIRKLVVADLDLSKLDALEKDELNNPDGTSKTPKEDGDDDEEENEEEVDEEDEFDDNDYAVDYYDDEHDALGADSDGEREYS